MNSDKNFLDSRTLMAVLLTFVVWIGWQWHLQKKYPNASSEAQSATTAPTESKLGDSAQGAQAIAGATAASVKSDASAAKRDEFGANESLPEQFIKIEDENWTFSVSSKGMGIKDFELKKYSDRLGQPIRLGAEALGRLPYELSLVGRSGSLHFELARVSANQIVGRARLGQMEITRTLNLNSELYQIESLTSINPGKEVFAGLVLHLAEKMEDPPESRFLSSQFERQEIFLFGGEGKDRHHLNGDEETTFTNSKTSVASFGSQYFTQAFVDSSDIMPETKVQVSAKSKAVLANVTYSVTPGANQGALTFKQIEFIGPKDLTLLSGVHANLAGIVDFGFFSFIGRPILKALKLFYQWVGNWGIAIVLLTILVRFLVLPFNVMSFRSMKAMQVIQPQLQQLKEKHKNDTQKQQLETMELFRRHKVNPLGGCLPILLQIPIFFALYQVLGHSIELYKSPFGLWIHDLSAKDPYFVMPVLMGITMFIQQKLTPTTMDPMQAKVMMFMPIMFAGFMLALPSGLTLYIFVSTLFGIGQQLYLLKTTHSHVVKA